MDTDVIVQNDPEQSDEASLAAEISKQNTLPILIVTNNPASDSKMLVQPFSFPAPRDSLVASPPLTINGQVIRTLSVVLDDGGCIWGRDVRFSSSQLVVITQLGCRKAYITQGEWL